MCGAAAVSRPNSFPVNVVRLVRRDRGADTGRRAWRRYDVAAHRYGGDPPAGRARAKGEEEPIISGCPSPNHDTLAWDVLITFSSCWRRPNAYLHFCLGRS